MEHKRNFTDYIFSSLKKGYSRRMKWERRERCVGEVTKGCRILVGEVERSCVEFGLGSFGRKGLASVADEVTIMEHWRNDTTGGDRRTLNKTIPIATLCFTNSTCSGLGSNRAFVLKGWR